MQIFPYVPFFIGTGHLPTCHRTWFPSYCCIFLIIVIHFRKFSPNTISIHSSRYNIIIFFIFWTIILFDWKKKTIVF
ncbi:hypothetical protein BLA29_001249 [Euroglyphus maynei]|uniref:Uncharacterized protein n=1 Tax=Euroglyphus maynei TaxID=6958 RepID=A0A1Y3AZ33_EURMA|nr:hypothetical protein BLA29_001249 [Euroglyphus maynei]